MKRVSLNRTKKGLSIGLTTGIAAACLAIFLSPFLFMVFTSLKTQGQISVLGGPIWPAQVPEFEYNGKMLDVYTVPMPDGTTRDLAALKKMRTQTTFVDPQNPEAEPFVFDGFYGSLKRP